MKGSRAKPELRDIHALKNVTVDVRTGERVGLLGHNGAGKSTFLKTVAGLYPISSGRLRVQGEVRALFDLSLGFEPDATGRENILSWSAAGHVTGLHARKGGRNSRLCHLGEFIDYPVLTHSVGMQVRLAFAISTLVGGDILLLDEIISAGDAAFREKARSRLVGMIDRAEILVLATHDLGTLSDLCTRLLLLDHGELIFDGPVAEGIRAYTDLVGESALSTIGDRAEYEKDDTR